MIEGITKGKFGQARCTGCNSWHFALQLDEYHNIIELKCCRCQKLIKYDQNVIVKDLTKSETKN